eukprot:Sspe_Gene.102870::Locus_78699_Transcript_1_1_Confidence_1.000_Length_1411::g.102870::m.102870/K14406/CSTF1; cleavage stimulation factor subunit 1
METEKAMYRMVVRQLLSDGYTDAARAVSESTMAIASPAGGEANKLRSIVLAATSPEGDGAGETDPFTIPPSSLHLGSCTDAPVLRYLAQHPRPVRALQFSQDGKYLASGSVDGSIQVNVVARMLAQSTKEEWGNKGSSKVAQARVFDENPLSVECLQFSPCSPVLLSGCKDGSVRLFNYTRPKATKSVTTFADEYAVRAMAIHPLGKHLVTGVEHPVLRLWDMEMRRVYRAPDHVSDSLSTSAGVVNDVAFSPDGRTYASATADGKLKIWDPNQPRWLVTPINHCHSGAEVTSVQYSRSGKLILTAGRDGCTRVFDMRTFNCLSMSGKTRQTMHKTMARFTSQEECIAAVLSEKDRVVLMERGQDVVKLPHSTGVQVRSLAASPTAPHVATGDDGHKVRLWAPSDDDEMVIDG